MTSGRLGQCLGTEHVGPEEAGRVQDGQAVVRLGGEVDDHVDLMLGQRLGHAFEITDVSLDEHDPIFDIGEVGPVAGVRQHIEGDDRIVGVALHPVPHEIRSDKAGTTGHE